MANKGKYIDRNPTMRTAGKVFEPLETVGDTLKIYSPEEAARSIMHMKCKQQIENIKETESLGYSQFVPVESVKDLLSPESKKSRFVAFKEKFSEDMFFKKPGLGEVQNCQSKPDEYNNLNFTYGVKNISSGSAYDLILPRKTPQQIKQEYLKWHDKYVISHKHYLPSERLTRQYGPGFDPKATFGISTKVDTTGQRAKQCLQHCERNVVINKVQKMFLNRSEGRLGQKIDRYNLNLDPTNTFGKPNRYPSCEARCLIENIELSVKEAKMFESLSHVIKLRRSIANRTDFHMYDLKVLLNKFDEKGNGFIKFPVMMKALRSLRIFADQEKLRLAIEQFHIGKKDDQSAEDVVNIEEFWKLLHIKYPLPHITILFENAGVCGCKETTYRLLCQDRTKPVPERIEHKRKDEDDDRVTAADVISPDIPMNFGLVPRDFEVLRPKEELKRVFKRVLNEDKFEKVWLFGTQKKGSEVDCKMSVKDFRSFMDEYAKQNPK